ncbi:hypothetical protein LEP1GSC052_2841 [Leptospira kmetyi serovar Malaysia str. Bejo-Iso9]|nr:hypothetical protein LEP1GSC052_2841 [Leptospira kmetyi serovar Malaysia str. Bejo-Iso9]
MRTRIRLENFFSFGVTENDLKLRSLFHRTYRKAKNPDSLFGKRRLLRIYF